MTVIKLHNTKTRKKEIFEPIDASNVRMYVCGPTVYDRAHLGNARPVVVFDVLYRLLRHVYGVDHVTYVRNFTDVDDKINARAAKSGRSIGDITAETTQWFLDDMAALGALEPDHMPRATEYIGTLQENGHYNHMIGMIEDLIAKGHAYPAEGHVLFAVESYKEYGALSGRSIKDMIAGARVEVAPYKRNPMDFVLWKPSTGDQPGWESPWGFGRPGWHIECSAMSFELLGESFDIHGGGNDLTFPHHENEIAQSMCVHPEGEFARVWMHNEMLQVEGKKMSKSLGNFFTVHDLLEQGVPGEVIRFVFLSTHYRKPMDWTKRKREEAEKRLDNLAQALSIANKSGLPPSEKFSDLPHGMQLSLANDLDTHGAIVCLEAQAKLLLGLETGDAVSGSLSVDADKREEAMSFQTGLDALGLYDGLLKRQAKLNSAVSQLDEVHLKFVLVYELAKQTKDFAGVDEMKKALDAAGVETRISKEGIDLIPKPTFDPTKLELLK